MDHAPAPPAPGAVVLALEDVSKSFGAVAALRGAQLELRAGEAHALVGENGAGKSHAGQDPRRGARPGRRPRAARRRSRSTLDNPAARPGRRHRGHLPGADALPRPVGRGEHLHGPPAAHRRTPDRPQGAGRALPGAVRAARRHASTPTARRAACPSPTSRWSRSPRRSRSTPACWSWTSRPPRSPASRSSGCSPSPARCGPHGAAVLFISHRFDEVFDLCDRITVMRDGQWVVHRPGRRPHRRPGGAAHGRPRGRLALPEAGRRARRGRARGPRAHPARASSPTSRFDVRAGEIVALAGLVGAGPQRGRPGGLRRRRLRRRLGPGRAARTLRQGSPAAAMAAGIALVPEDRRQQGLVMELSVERNVTLTRRWKLARFGLLSARGERATAADWAKRCRSRPASCPTPCRRSPAATSRRSSWPSGCPPTPGC